MHIDDIIKELRSTPEVTWVLTHTWTIESFLSDEARLLRLFESNNISSYVFSLANTYAKERLACDVLERPGQFECTIDVARHTNPQRLLTCVLHVTEACRKTQRPFSFDGAWLAQFETVAAADPALFSRLTRCGALTTPQAMKERWLLGALDHSLALARTTDFRVVMRETQYLTGNIVLFDADVYRVRCLFVALVKSDASLDMHNRSQLLSRTQSFDLKKKEPDTLLQKGFPEALTHWPVITELGLSLAQAWALIFPEPQVVLPAELPCGL